MIKRNLLILGAGQYGIVAMEVALSMECFNIIEFLDDKSSVAIGKITDFVQHKENYDCAVVAIGNADLRINLIEKLINAGFEVPCLIHKRAYVSSSAVVGKGCIIEPMAVVHTGVSVCDGCLISAGAILNHNCVVGRGCHIDCGSIVGARVNISEYSKVSCGTIICE